jgi:methylmalonyl-CoA mutase N-terminal domain/subunit
VAAALQQLVATAPQYLESHQGPRAELMPLIIDAVRARASVGEIADALESVWGRYRPE